MFLQRNTAGQVFTIPGTLRAIADGSAVTSGATLTWIKDGTSAASAGTLTHVSDGGFIYAPTQGETDAKILGWVLTKTGAAGLAGSVRTTNADPNDATRLDLTALPNAVAAASGGLPTVGTGTGQISLASGRVDLGKWLGDVPAAVDTSDGTIAVHLVACGDGAIASNAFALGAIDASAFAQGAADKVWLTTVRTLTGGTGTMVNDTETIIESNETINQG